MFQTENNILVHNSNAGIDNVHFRYSNCCEHSKVEKVIVTFVIPTVVFVLIATLWHRQTRLRHGQNTQIHKERSRLII
jgi:hypothetical protein